MTAWCMHYLEADVHGRLFSSRIQISDTRAYHLPRIALDAPRAHMRANPSLLRRVSYKLAPRVYIKPTAPSVAAWLHLSFLTAAPLELPSYSMGRESRRLTGTCYCLRNVIAAPAQADACMCRPTKTCELAAAVLYAFFRAFVWQALWEPLRWRRRQDIWEGSRAQAYAIFLRRLYSSSSGGNGHGWSNWRLHLL